MFLQTHSSLSNLFHILLTKFFWYRRLFGEKRNSSDNNTEIFSTRAVVFCQGELFFMDCGDKVEVAIAACSRSHSEKRISSCFMGPIGTGSGKENAPLRGNALHKRFP